MDRPRRTAGFTLVELLVVVVIIAILAALLLPAIGSAMRTAKNAAVTADLNTLATSLAAFNEKFGEFPPSRIMLSEMGVYDVDSTGPAGKMIVSANGTGGNDVTYAALAQRSLSVLRKFWPRVQFTTVPGATAAPGVTLTRFYDFNGDGKPATASYILEGDECLTFFLGGIPLNTESPTDPVWSMSGFGKVPTNPFSNNLDDGNAMYDGNRTTPMYEFRPERLRDMDPAASDTVRFPAYHDSLGTDAPIAYFSAYGGEQYDPNDCNRDERNDDESTVLLRQFRVSMPVVDNTGAVGRVAVSSAPNPYTASAPKAPTVQWQKGQSFQLISAGADGQFGHGGQYLSAANVRLPANPATEANPPMDRARENDNICNFAAGPLD